MGRKHPLCIASRQEGDNTFTVPIVGETGGNCNIFHINAHYVEHVFYLTIYLCLIPQPHMLSKRIAAFIVLIVTHFDAIDEFMQPGNCYN